MQERYFLLNMICEGCNKTNRIHELDNDFIGYLHCPNCKCRDFKLKKQFVSESHFTALKGEERVVLTEITKRRSH